MKFTKEALGRAHPAGRQGRPHRMGRGTAGIWRSAPWPHQALGRSVPGREPSSGVKAWGMPARSALKMPGRLPVSALPRSSWAVTLLRIAVRARARALTLGVVIGRYLEAKRDRLRTNTFKAATRYFAVHWRPLHDRPLDAIVRAEVAARLQELIKAHGRTVGGKGARQSVGAIRLGDEGGTV